MYSGPPDYKSKPVHLWREIRSKTRCRRGERIHIEVDVWYLLTPHLHSVTPNIDEGPAWWIKALHLRLKHQVHVLYLLMTYIIINIYIWWWWIDSTWDKVLFLSWLMFDLPCLTLYFFITLGENLPFGFGHSFLCLLILLHLYCFSFIVWINKKYIIQHISSKGNFTVSLVNKPSLTIDWKATWRKPSVLLSTSRVIHLC